MFRSSRHVYAQVIDDVVGRTIAGSVDDGGPGPHQRWGHGRGGEVVGERVAERAKVAGIDTVVFDRGGFRYHGRVAVVADGARSGGLEF